MTIAEPTVLVFAFVAKNDTYANARPDGDSAKVGGNGLVKPLPLSFDDSPKFEICMALYVKTYFNRVRHNCVPLTARMARLGVRHGIIQADAVPKNSWISGCADHARLKNRAEIGQQVALERRIVGAVVCGACIYFY